MTDMLSHLAEDLIAKHTITSGKIFLSYSRKNREYARALYEKLTRMGFDLWRDVHDIKADSDDWWKSIEAAIEGCETVILCMSLPALKSAVVSDEWMHARKHQKRVIPVVADDIWTHPEVTRKDDPFVIPNWMQRKNWMDFRAGVAENNAAWANLIRTLNEKPDVKRFIHMIGELPPRFVSRPTELNRAVGALVDDKHDAVAMTTALKGAGGYGKTTLAKAIARDTRIQGAFDDGILWVTLGEELLKKQGDELQIRLISLVLELIDALKHERPVINSLDMARTQLQEAIGDAYILLVIDDVWDERHLTPFLVKTKHSACLITTRSTDALGKHAMVQQPIDKMQPLEAVELLSAAIAPDDAALHAAALRELARDLREYPLLLGLVNTQMTTLMEDLRLSLGEALDIARQTLREGGVLGFDDTDTDARDKAVSNTLEVSIRQLKPEDRQRMYRELAIFAEDAPIPLTTLERYWGLTTIATLQFCQTLYRKTALLHSFEGMAIRIHDVFRDCLIRHWDADQRRALHRRLIDCWGDMYALPDNYAWRYIAYHLIQAGQAETLYALLTDYRWLQAKLDATAPAALEADCADYLNSAHAASNSPLTSEGEGLRVRGAPIRLLHSALTMSAHILDQDRAQLPYQLTGRLWTHRQQPDIAPLWRACHAIAPLELLESQAYPPMLQAGGALIRTFSGHASSVYSALELKDGRILSWSYDQTLRLWSSGGVPLAKLTGHTDWVTGATVLVDGRMLSWSVDGTLRLWSADGAPLAELTGHTSRVMGATVLSDGRILSWSDDTTLRLWSADGAPLAELTGHTNGVMGATVLSDGRMLSWSDDTTLRLWSADGAPLAELSGHTSGVMGATVLSDGRILSWSWDTTLRLWSADGAPLAELTGHSDKVNGATVLADEWILSWSSDTTLRLWSADGAPLAELTGHTSGVMGATVLSDGRILSWSWDITLRLWSVDGAPLANLTGHTDSINGATVLDDRRILSWSADETLRLWSVDGAPLATLTGHTDSINGATVLDNRQILSWSADKTLRLWSPKDVSPIELTGHTDWVTGVTALADGRILSWSKDTTLRLWSADGAPLAELTGHTDQVRGATALADGRILSWSKDTTLRLWSADGAPLAELTGHTDAVWNATVLADGRMLSQSDNRNLRLWSADGAPLAELRRANDAIALADGRMLSWSWNATLQLWSADGAPLAELTGHTNRVNGVTILKDQRMLSWSEDTTLRLWSADGAPLAELTGHTNRVNGVTILKDQRMLSWSDDTTLRLWSADGAPLAELTGHTDQVRDATALVDGRILSWSKGATLRLWSSNGAPLAVLPDWDEDEHALNRWAEAHGVDVRVLYININKHNPDSPFAHIYKGLLWVHGAGCFIGDAWFTRLVVSGRALVVGDAAGRVIFLRVGGAKGTFFGDKTPLLHNGEGAGG